MENEMELVSLRDLVAEFGTGMFHPTTDSHQGVVARAAAVDHYVWPTLEVSHPRSLPGADDAVAALEDSQVLLISSPGAMGKTQAAKKFSESTNSPYVDLSEFSVGAGSLGGVLGYGYDVEEYARLITSVRSGHAYIVIDGIDEARLRSGDMAFIDFIEGFKKVLKGHSSRMPSVIIFGRPDSIADALILFNASGVSVSRATLKPLDYRGATELISAVLLAPESSSGFPPYNAHQDHPGPFSELRDRLMALMASAYVGESVSPHELESRWAEYEEFVGYPPVLSSLSLRLAEDNLFAARNSLDSSSDAEVSRRQGVMLNAIIGHILDREMSKVSKGLKGNDNFTGSTSSSPLYSIDEQMVRILQYLNNISPSEVNFPYGVKEGYQANYIEQTQPFVHEHPLLVGTRIQNPVFVDYVHAWYRSRGRRYFQPQARVCFDRMFDYPGPFFARFLHGMATCAHVRIAEDDVDSVIASHSLSAGSTVAEYTHRGNDVATLRLLYLGGEAFDSFLSDEMVFLIEAPSGELKLRSEISNLTVHTEYAVRLVSGDASVFRIGPNVILDVGEIDLDSEVLRVNHDRGQKPGTLILSRSPASHPALKHVKAYGPRALTVFWPEMDHRFTDYMLRLENLKVPVPAPRIHALVVMLLRIFKAFNGSKGRRPAVNSSKVKRVLIGGDKLANVVFDNLQGLGIVQLAGELYELDTDRLGEFDVAWHNLSPQDPVEELRSLIVALLRAENVMSELREAVGK
ncbi:hypothetical protein V1463_04600 [Micrococcus yunnanensis]|uniref:hypothetical protein n=1 Tax=Micrococcus yunnanensis TaxID=566027 RepID=UPI00300E6D60